MKGGGRGGGDLAGRAGRGRRQRGMVQQGRAAEGGGCYAGRGREQGRSGMLESWGKEENGPRGWLGVWRMQARTYSQAGEGGGYKGRPSM
jgi:hypothetical protein